MKARAVLFGLLASAAIPSLGDAIAETSLRAHMLGVLDDPDRHDPATLGYGEPTFTGLPFGEAKDFFRRKTAMTPDEFRALEDRYKTKGFSVAEVTDRHVLEEAHHALTGAIDDGTAERDVLQRVADAFKAAGVEHPGDYQLQTTFDQAVLGSYAAGRYAQMIDPAVLAARPFWQYRTVGDSRVRPAHRAMNRRTFPADSGVWATWYPPNGFRCRCGVITLSPAQIALEGITVEDHVPHQVETPEGVVQMRPDPGFSGSPATQIAADRTVAAIRAEAHRAGALGATPEDLGRIDDAKRAARVERFAGLSREEVAAELARQRVFNAYPAALPEAPDGELFVDWHMYSQNLDSAEQLTTRLVQEHGLYGLKDRIGLLPKATWFGDWPAKWDDAEVVHDAELGRELGYAPGQVVASSTEYALRLRVHPHELKHVLAFLTANGSERGASPIRRAWDIQDVRVSAGKGAELPEDGKDWRRAYRNVRRRPPGEIVTLSRAPLPGWDAAELIAVNETLYGVLP